MGGEDDRTTKPKVAPVDPLAVVNARAADPAPAPLAKGSDRRERHRPAAPTVQVEADEISGLIEMAEVMVAQKPPADVVPLADDDKKTRKMDAEQFRALIRAQQQADAPVVSRAPTRSDAAKTKALAEQTAAEKPRSITTTAELMAQVDDAFADFGPEPDPAPAAAPPPAEPPPPVVEAAPAAPLVDTESKPVKQPALIVPDHRLDTRHAARIAPITKPPDIAETAATPPMRDDAPAPPARVEAATPVPRETPPVREAMPALVRREDAPAPPFGAAIATRQQSRSSIALVSILVVAIVVAIVVVLLS